MTNHFFIAYTIGKSFLEGCGNGIGRAPYFIKKLPVALHSKGDLSYLSPLNTGCRREPESVFIIYFITHTRAGESQTAFSFPWPSITGMGGEINNLLAGGLLLDQSLQPFLRYYSAGWNSCSMELMRILAIVSSASFTAG